MLIRNFDYFNLYSFLLFFRFFDVGVVINIDETLRKKIPPLLDE